MEGSKDPASVTHEGAMPVIRLCVSDDLAAVERIYAHYVVNTTTTFEEDPPTLADWQRRLGEITEAGLPFLVAEVDGAVVGYGYCTKWRSLRPAYRHTAEDSVYVDVEKVGRGFGTLLLRALLTGCEAAGIRQVIAVVATGWDAASMALHRRCGFVEAGRLVGVGYKHGRWLDTVLMQRSLVAAET